MGDRVRRGSVVDLAWGVWSRRKWLAIVIFLASCTAAVSVAKFLPNIYRATTTVIVERHSVSESLVRSSVTGELETRLHTISQEILSRARLKELILRLDLYPDLTRRASLDAVTELMRREIALELKGVEQTSGRAATIAFTLSYRGRDPEKVALVTNTLASFYIAEDLKVRERQATGTAEFLKLQLETAKKRLDDQERRVNEFRLRYAGELPQQEDLNRATLERLNAQVRWNMDMQVRASERREALAKQLGDGGSVGPDATATRLARLHQELTQLRTRFTDNYPDVIRVKAEIAALERQLAEAKPPDKPDAPGGRPPGRLSEAISGLDTELKALKDEEKRLREAIATYQRRIENVPRREQEYQELTRDQGTSKELYFSLLKRYEEAQLSENLEQRQTGERFRILDPALPPRQPAAPDRDRLVAFGLMVSLALAAGAVVLAEQVDTSFHTVDDLRAFTSVPVLSSIPRILTTSDTRRRRWRFWLGAVAVVMGLVLIAGASRYLALDNEQLVWTLARGRV